MLITGLFTSLRGPFMVCTFSRYFCDFVVLVGSKNPCRNLSVLPFLCRFGSKTFSYFSRRSCEGFFFIEYPFSLSISVILSLT